MKFDIDSLPDDFSKMLFNGSLKVLDDKENPVRLHLFAAGFRELFTYILHLYAPDEDVRACSWFRQAEDTNTITRRQRATYATQGGLTDAFIKGLGLDVGDLHRNAILAIETLSKATHVKPGSVILEIEEIKKFSETAIRSLDGLMKSFRMCREAVIKTLKDSLYESVAESFVTRTFDQIDIFAGKGYEVDTFILDEDIFIEAITSSEILVRFTGTAPVTLHYGKGDDAAAINHDFPFWMKFCAPVSNPEDLEYISSDFDDSGWYI